jgi:hypothetical protein
METESPRLAKAEQRLQEIRSKRTEIQSHLESLNAQLAPAQKEIGREYLTGERKGLLRAVELRVEIEAAQTALELLADDQASAELEVGHAKATEVRDRAKQKRKELESLDAETGALLAKLSALENVNFTRSILSSEPVLGT